VLGVCLPGVSGYECCYELRAEFGPALAILLASSVRTERLDATVGLLLGADDVIVGPLNEGELLARVTRLVSTPGRTNGSQRPELTNREGEVLALLADGLQQKEIAHELGISPKTVATYLERIRTQARRPYRTEPSRRRTAADCWPSRCAATRRAAS
jgi:two-component system, LuxR family, response regulator FixJ